MAPADLPQPANRSLDAAEQTLSTYLTEEHWRAAIARINQTPTALLTTDRRVDLDRIEQHLSCLLRIDQGDEEATIFLVRTRNISDGGLSVLHGGPIDPNTPCVVALEAAAGRGLIQRAKVVWSRKIEGNPAGLPEAWEMGLQFDRPINATQFLGR
jgi:hypothetical protein